MLCLVNSGQEDLQWGWLIGMQFCTCVADEVCHGCRYWDGVYILYTYGAQRKVSQAVQKLLSTPVVGSEKNVLRHMTFII